MEGSTGVALKAEGYVRFKKVKGVHRMFCPVRGRKVVLGQDKEDGDIAYFLPTSVPPGSNEAWERVDHDDHVAEATEKELQEKAGEPDGTLAMRETDEGYDVVNTATDSPINTSPLTEDEAKAIVAGSPEEKKGILAKLKEKFTGGDKDIEVCPHGHELGKDHDDHEDCDECALAEKCQALRQEGEG